MMIETYEDLLQALLKLTPEQRKQKAQAVNSGSDETTPAGCSPIYSIGTVREMFETASEDGSYIDGQYIMDCDDGTHYPDSVVILIDSPVHDIKNDTFFHERNVLLKTIKKMQNISNTGSALDAENYAREALQKIKQLADNRKERIENLEKNKRK